MSLFLDPQKLFPERATVFPVLHFSYDPLRQASTYFFTYIHLRNEQQNK